MDDIGKTIDYRFEDRMIFGVFTGEIGWHKIGIEMLTLSFKKLRSSPSENERFRQKTRLKMTAFERGLKLSNSGCTVASQVLTSL